MHTYAGNMLACAVKLACRLELAVDEQDEERPAPSPPWPPPSRDIVVGREENATGSDIGYGAAFATCGTMFFNVRVGVEVETKSKYCRLFMILVKEHVWRLIARTQTVSKKSDV